MSTDETAKELVEFLKTTKASAVEIPHKTVIEVNANMTPIAAAKLLWKNKVIGAPVWDETHQRYLGFFDMRDLLSTIIISHKEEEERSKAILTGQPQEFTKWFLKDSNNENFTVSYLAARNPFVSLTQDATLLEVCQLCARRHCHRVPLIDHSTGRCVKILSQSSLVKFLAEHLLAETKSDNIKAFFQQTLAQATFPYQKPVKSAPDTATARDVFQLMDENRLSGIAVVSSDDGALIGNTSASDIKLAVAVEDNAMLADLGLNIMSYLSAVRQEDPTKEAKYPSSHVRESSTLVHAIKLLAKTGYHRVFVCDSDIKPVGVVSVTDVVEFLAGQ